MEQKVRGQERRGVRPSSGLIGFRIFWPIDGRAIQEVHCSLTRPAFSDTERASIKSLLRSPPRFVGDGLSGYSCKSRSSAVQNMKQSCRQKHRKFSFLFCFFKAVTFVEQLLLTFISVAGMPELKDVREVRQRILGDDRCRNLEYE